MRSIDGFEELFEKYGGFKVRAAMIGFAVDVNSKKGVVGTGTKKMKKGNEKSAILINDGYVGEEDDGC